MDTEIETTLAEPKRGRGRPKGTRKYPDAPVGGAPQLTIRFDPEALARIYQRGGAVWAREVLLRALAEVEAGVVGCKNE